MSSRFGNIVIAGREDDFLGGVAELFTEARSGYGLTKCPSDPSKPSTFSYWWILSL